MVTWPDTEVSYVRYPGARPGERASLHLQILGRVRSSSGTMEEQVIGTSDVPLASLLAASSSATPQQVWYKAVDALGASAGEALVSIRFEPSTTGTRQAPSKPVASASGVSVASGEWGEEKQVADVDAAALLVCALACCCGCCGFCCVMNPALFMLLVKDKAEPSCLYLHVLLPFAAGRPSAASVEASATGSTGSPTCQCSLCSSSACWDRYAHWVCCRNCVGFNSFLLLWRA